MAEKKRILIIKTGHSETFVQHEANKDPSLGDVVRTTPLLSLFENDWVYWVCSKESRPLLKHVSGIYALWDRDEFEANGFDVDFDLVINLERELISSVFLKAKKAVGYSVNKKLVLLNDTQEYDLSSYLRQCHRLGLTLWQEKLFHLLGKKYAGEKYAQPLDENNERLQYDIGLNWKVGHKWPTKQTDIKLWKELCQKLEMTGYRVTWQEGFDNLEVYQKWLSSSKLIITSDSLGLHLSLALKKRLIALFGPTPREEVDLYGLGHWVPFKNPSSYDCLPCLSTSCDKDKLCSNFLDIGRIVEQVEKTFKMDQK